VDRPNRRDALVRAAFQCVAERGFEGLRLRLVAADAGIDHSTLHHYFPTKEALVAAVLNHVTRQFWETMRADLAPAERLHHHLATLGTMIREQPALFTVLAELDLRARRDPTIASTIDDDEAGWRASLTDLFRLGAAQGAWRASLDVAAAPELVIAVVKGIRLIPNRAEPVLAEFERSLVGPPSRSARDPRLEGG
jgi:AcrR family transcriptional regulator